MEIQEAHRLFLKFVYWILLPFTFISYLLEPFTDDVLVYFGAAKVTALTPGFPMTLDSVWESRFVGHRFLYYVLNMLDPFQNWAYTILAKLIVAVVTIIILYYFAKRVAEKMDWSFDYVFILGFLGLFAINCFIIFSSEYMSVVVAMLMLTMLLDERQYVQTLSGLLILPLLILKGLPVLLVLIVILAVVMAVKDYRHRFTNAAYSLPFVAIALGEMIWYFPHFISDVFLLRAINYPQTNTITSILMSFTYRLIGMVGMVPVIFIGACAMFLLLSVVVKEHLRDLGLLLGMWTIGVVYVAYISEYWYYHYYLMLIPAIFTTCYFLKIYPANRQAFILMIVAILIIFVAVVTGWSPGMGFIQYNTIADRQVIVNNVTEHFPDILTQPATLYLDEGTISYYLPTKSACRYVSAFPYARDMPNWSMKDSAEYWEDRNCSLGYTGRYVIVNPFWFHTESPTHTEMVTKLDSQYTRVYTLVGNYTGVGGTSWYWDIWQRKAGAV